MGETFSYSCTDNARNGRVSDISMGPLVQAR